MATRHSSALSSPFAIAANYSCLASPPLVIANALAGTVDVDLTTEPLGVDREGRMGIE
ncbi:MAG: hypothetical protein KA072_12220 [Thermoanaerobaculaceae bacterium]|nr:hypothetical protein [Thermoanaerobaculaceae bacterium]MDI9622252.1 hypothetical protein [Acidobacteriota bacterium]NLH11870.1 hypothetical protein [Holophagae bacterium]HPW56303.1 hypothetical protein [Thermoanaerobaculaceae bacterium]